MSEREDGDLQVLKEEGVGTGESDIGEIHRREGRWELMLVIVDQKICQYRTLRKVCNPNFRKGGAHYVVRVMPFSLLPHQAMHAFFMQALSNNGKHANLDSRGKAPSLKRLSVRSLV